jgi:diamine N-acetyltransferase
MLMPNVTIRPLEEEDARTSFKWRNIPEVWKLTDAAWSREITYEDELSWIRKVMADPSGRRFAIIADGQYVGNIYLTDIDGKTAQYHIFIGEREQWGKGIARAASQQILDYARDLGLATVWLSVKKQNPAAIAVYRELGFVTTKDDGITETMVLQLHQTEPGRTS